MADTNTKARIIVVEDDPVLRTALTFALEIEGYAVTSCATGEALLATLLPEANACLVIEHHLPGRDGLDALKVLRKRGVTLPAILLAAHPRPGLTAAAARRGAAVLDKALIGPELARRVEEQLAGRELARQVCGVLAHA